MEWAREIDELHAFFEAWLRGAVASMDRMEAVLAPDFTMVGPHGNLMHRNQTVGAVRRSRGRSVDLRITTSDHELIASTAEFLVARYVEAHDTPDGANRRLSTVVFRSDETAPNGLAWLSVHETFVDRGA